MPTLKTNGFGVFSTHTGEASFSDFNNQQVTYKYEKWTYTPIKYWPTTSGTINFLAYAPYVQGKQLTNNTCMEFDVAHDVANQKDLLWSRVKAQINTPITSTNNKVKFQFAHALSRLGYTVKTSATAEGTSITLNQITLAGSNDGAKGAFYSAGIIDLSKTSSTDLWTNLNSDTKLKFDWVSSNKELSSNETKNDETEYLFVIPQDFSQKTTGADELYVIVDYTISYSDGTTMKTKVYQKIEKNFEQGKAYMLNLTIGLPIEFDVDLTEGVGVDGWGEDENINIGSNDNLWDGIK